MQWKRISDVLLSFTETIQSLLLFLHFAIALRYSMASPNI